MNVPQIEATRRGGVGQGAGMVQFRWKAVGGVENGDGLNERLENHHRLSAINSCCCELLIDLLILPVLGVGQDRDAVRRASLILGGRS